MIVLAVPGVLVVIFLLWVIVVYNGLVRRRTVVEEAWSGIDVQLKRRSDLIPNIVSVVKGYASHERSTLAEVVRLRGQAQKTEGVGSTAEIQGQIGAALGRLFALAESYPDLKASQNFMELQESLSEIEEQIQFSRRYYNGAVRELNISVDSFPSHLVASRFGFVKAEFFELENGADRTVPEVML